MLQAALLHPGPRPATAGTLSDVTRARRFRNKTCAKKTCACKYCARVNNEHAEQGVMVTPQPVRGGGGGRWQL